VLIVLASANLFGLYLGLTHRQEFFTRFPRFTPELWAVYLLCPPGALVGLAALWFWKKWGLWLVLVVGGIVLAVELYALPFGWHLARIVASMALVSYFAHRSWQRFV
jgi:hypothetical protein